MKINCLLIVFLALAFLCVFNIRNTIAKSNISSFIYQLQNINHKELFNTEFDLAVIDIDEASFSKEQISKLQDQGKIIVTYLSIGEAENYRDYWTAGDWDNNPPEFLELENSDFEGNFKVEFWNPEWQKIILNKIEEIIDAGYNGVYLDIIDAYFYFEEKGRGTARQEMIDFVTNIANKARNENLDFLIIPQNAAELVEDENYLSIIDGLGKEDTFFFDNRKIDKKTREEDFMYLDKIIESGKFILTTDYPTKKRKQCIFIREAKKKGYIPFVSNRDLDKISLPICK